MWDLPNIKVLPALWIQKGRSNPYMDEKKALDINKEDKRDKLSNVVIQLDFFITVLIFFLKSILNHPKDLIPVPYESTHWWYY